MPPKNFFVALFFAAPIFLCVWAYAPVVDYPYITYDDPYYVYENDIVTEGLSASGVRRAFTERHLGNWYPLTLLSYQVEIEIFGLRPGLQHAVNLFFHILAAVLLGLAFYGMTQRGAFSVIATGLFALHPEHVEPVVWISSRKDVLSLFFFTLMLVAYARYAKGPSKLRMMAVALCFACGLMSKASLIVAPALLLILDGWPLARIDRAKSLFPQLVRLVLEKWPLILLAGAMSVVAYAMQRNEGALGEVQAYPVAERIANSVYALTVYVYHAIWPERLAIFYPHRGADISILAVLAAAALLLALSAAAFLFARKFPAGAVAWLWFLVALAPVSGVVQIGSHGMADRYAYLANIGLIIAVAAAADQGMTRTRSVRIVTALAVVAVAVAATLGTRFQVNFWRDSETIYQRAIAVTENNFRAHYNLGNDYLRTGRFEDAIVDFRAAVDARPNYPQAYANLGIALAQAGEYPDAQRALQTATEQNPALPEAWYNLGLVHLREGNFREAVAALERYLALNPNDPEAARALREAETRMSRD